MYFSSIMQLNGPDKLFLEQRPDLTQPHCINQKGECALVSSLCCHVYILSATFMYRNLPILGPGKLRFVDQSHMTWWVLWVSAFTGLGQRCCTYLLGTYMYMYTEASEPDNTINEAELLCACCGVIDRINLPNHEGVHYPSGQLLDMVRSKRANLCTEIITKQNTGIKARRSKAGGMRFCHNSSLCSSVGESCFLRYGKRPLKTCPSPRNGKWISEDLL